MHVDLIGDIHGHAYALVALLNKLGYQWQRGAYRHPERRVVFVGDYIDRGPNALEVLEIVRAMVEEGQAVALMGNHEYNAVCFHTPKEGGGYLRPHTYKNIMQHLPTLKSLDTRKGQLDFWVGWFRQLPLYLETEGFRAIHACWSKKQLEVLQQFGVADTIPESLWADTANEKHPLFTAVEILLKGLELPLPKGAFFRDKDGHKRERVRAKWWVDPSEKKYGELLVAHAPDPQLAPVQDLPVSVGAADPQDVYPNADKPVFFGHYWLKAPQPILFPESQKVGCLDFSVAKNGFLTAYRFDGESYLDPAKFVWV